MILCGAVAFRMIWVKEPLSKSEHRLAWFSIAFGHIYGICYVGMGAFFRKDWRKVLGAATWLGVVLYAHVWPEGKLSPFDHANIPPLLEVVRQTFGAIGSPHKAWVLHSVLALVGLTALAQAKDWRRLAMIAFYFAATVIAPLAATIISGYYFMPRQEARLRLHLSAFGAERLIIGGARAT